MLIMGNQSPQVAGRLHLIMALHYYLHHYANANHTLLNCNSTVRKSQNKAQFLLESMMDVHGIRIMNKLMPLNLPTGDSSGCVISRWPLPYADTVTHHFQACTTLAVDLGMSCSLYAYLLGYSLGLQNPFSSWRLQVER